MSGDIAAIIGEDVDLGEFQGGSFEPIPAGWYPAQIESVEVKANRGGNGEGLKIMFAIVGDRFSGRKVFNWINLANPNAECVRIGKGELGRLAVACGIAGSPKDCAQLIDKLLQVKVEVEEQKGRKPENVSMDYLPMGADTAKAAKKAPGKPDPTARSAAPAKTVPAQETNTPPAGDSTGVKSTQPWMNRK